MRKVLFVLLIAPNLFADCLVSDAITSLRPGSQFILTNNDLSTLVWNSTQTVPTPIEVQNYISDCPNQTNLQQRTDALNDLLSSPEGRDKFIRAEGFVLIDRLNLLQQWDMNFQAMVAAATSLADLKLRVATLPALPDITPAQAKTAIQQKIGTGVSD